MNHPFEKREQNFAHYAPYTAAVEKEFFETVRREVDKAEKFYVDILDILKTDFQDLVLQSYRLLAIKKIFKKHDKIVGAVAVNQEMEALKYDVIDTITNKKAFWVKGEKNVGELLNEAEGDKDRREDLEHLQYISCQRGFIKSDYLIVLPSYAVDIC
ncbi:7937_t:CDS:2 [Paraglomus brasilianum]|uniref:7937_t:CDS:1 n=1 Tax=Paraglomus brasilianum TaxID=144538 RepID=A0A9N9AD27_9GLOM|nr:7937_t:CDS:2 [Paraglomus brasilianum]